MYAFDDYAVMIADPVRGGAYLAAIRENVRPGCVVADIGAGPGVLGVYAATLGARRVFLVEPDASVDAALAFASENGVLDRIAIIRGLSTDITLPERADFIVSDLRGVLPLFGDHLRAAADMRERHLAPGGLCAPLRDTISSALVEDAELHGRTVGGWSRVPSTVKHDTLTALLANRWYRTRATAEQMLTDPACWATIDYAEAPPPFDGRWSSVVTRDGVAHGILLWFDTELTSGTGFSNSPWAPRALYGQAYFPFAEPMTLREGDVVSGRVRAIRSGEEYEWCWTARLARHDGAVVTVSHASLLGKVLLPESLERRRGSYVPRRALEAEMLMVLLEQADGTRDLAALARLLVARFPAKFSGLPNALNFVARHEHLWIT